jgi:hypothetical protein
MFVARRQGARFDQVAWEAMLARELGPRAVTEFRSQLIDGKNTVMVASQAFGPCFRREKVAMKSDGNDVRGYRWTRIAGVPEASCRTW